MTWGERWLTAFWPFVGSQLPPAPARVLEIGCGPLGGFVPVLVERGYAAIGIDRNAPDSSLYQRLDFEQSEVPEPVDAIVACRSLHHVGDLDAVVGQVADALRPGGTLVVVEWAWERFDEPTARWCFERMDESVTSEPGWLLRRRNEWLAAGGAWDDYFGAWAGEKRLQSADQILRELDARFDRKLCDYGTYFFADLADIPERDEQAAIDADEIRATGIRYVGVARS